MWCPTCRADTAAQLSADDRRLSCARCGEELAVSASALRPESGHSVPLVHEAEELLARWSAEDLMLFEPVAGPGVAADRVLAPSEPQASTTAEEPVEAPNRAPARSPGRRRGERRTRQRDWQAIAGQLSAYAGILLLTCGTTLVIVSQYAGRPQQAVSGWLITTVGQMLLFLGVVTLVSSGLDQTRQEVARRLRRMSQQLEEQQTSTRVDGLSRRSRSQPRRASEAA